MQQRLQDQQDLELEQLESSISSATSSTASPTLFSSFAAEGPPLTISRRRRLRGLSKSKTTTTRSMVFGGVVFMFCLSIFFCFEVVTSHATEEAEQEQMEVLVSGDSERRHDLGYGGSCWVTRRLGPDVGSPDNRKTRYVVGVLAHRGVDSAVAEFNRTFGEYLTVTAGRRFDPPLTFTMKPLNYTQIFTESEKGSIDFIYVNPSAFSCIESEYESHSLVSQISRRNVGGITYHLKRFGGVIAVRSNNTSINTIKDLKNKIIGAASISGLGSGQMQYREMSNAGMSYVNSPRQLAFTSNQQDVVDGVLDGTFDAGFIRTDQLERSVDNKTGRLIDTTRIKVVDPIPGLNIDGVPFPFQSSTPLYPEWNVASLKHVSDGVAIEVQAALLAQADHARIHASVHKCEFKTNQTYCNSLPFPAAFSGPDESVRCDTSRHVAAVAFHAMSDAKISGWSHTLSYMSLRSMQEATGFITLDPQSNRWRCVRSANIYDSITCPDGYAIKTKEEVENGCTDAGLECKIGYQCICRPCYRLDPCVDSIEMLNGQCVDYSVFLPALLVPLALLSFGACVLTVTRKSKQLVKQAKEAAQNERDLNEFIA